MYLTNIKKGKRDDFRGTVLIGTEIDINILKYADLTGAIISKKQANYYKSMGIDLTGVIIGIGYSICEGTNLTDTKILRKDIHHFKDADISEAIIIEE